MKRLLLFSLLTGFSAGPVCGQDAAIVRQEQELKILLDSLRAAKNDAARNKWNKEFKKQFEVSLNEPTAFSYPFSLLTTVGKVDSPDRQIRVISWNIEQEDQSQKYCAFVLKADERKDTHKVFELKDNSFMLPPRTDDVLEADNWYGALYYAIIPVEKNNRTYYTLLGWDGNTQSSNIKLIDVLYFTGNNLRLGAPIFKQGNETKRRIYMEHSEKAVMSLRWDADHQRIIFDHLSPESPGMEGFFEFYVPDMSYDAYVFEGSKWVLKEDVIATSKGTGTTVKLHTIDPKTGEVEKVEVPNKWIDPTNAGAPGSKEVHVAMTPDDETAEKSGTKKTEKGRPANALEAYEQKKRHKKEKDPSSSFSNGTRKKKRHK